MILIIVCNFDLFVEEIIRKRFEIIKVMLMSTLRALVNNPVKESFYEKKKKKKKKTTTTTINILTAFFYFSIK